MQCTREYVFATYSAARKALVNQGATHAEAPAGRLQAFWRPAPAFPGEWGCCTVFQRTDGTWEVSGWLLDRGASDGQSHGGLLPFVAGMGDWPS